MDTTQKAGNFVKKIKNENLIHKEKGRKCNQIQADKEKVARIVYKRKKTLCKWTQCW